MAHPLHLHGPPPYTIDRRIISLDKLRPNTGQIPGLPKNPRIIKDRKFKALVKSLQDDPEMIDLRELLVFPYKEGGMEVFVIIAGNMRFKALHEIKATSAPCKVIPVSTPVEKLRAIAIKDNVPFGENDWDILANEWDSDELSGWGLDLPKWDNQVVSFKAKPKGVTVTVECSDETDKQAVIAMLEKAGYKAH